MSCGCTFHFTAVNHPWLPIGEWKHINSLGSFTRRRMMGQTWSLASLHWWGWILKIASALFRFVHLFFVFVARPQRNWFLSCVAGERMVCVASRSVYVFGPKWLLVCGCPNLVTSAKHEIILTVLDRLSLICHLSYPHCTIPGAEFRNPTLFHQLSIKSVPYMNPISYKLYYISYGVVVNIYIYTKLTI